MNTYRSASHRGNIPTDTIALINNLLRGVYFNTAGTVRDDWRALLKKGDVSVLAVRSKLRASAWRDQPRGPLIRYFIVLLSLFSELNLVNSFKRDREYKPGELEYRLIGDRSVDAEGPSVLVRLDYAATILGDQEFLTKPPIASPPRRFRTAMSASSIAPLLRNSCR